MLVIENKSIIRKSQDLVFEWNNNEFIHTSLAKKFNKVAEILKFSILISEPRLNNSKKE